MDHDLLRKLASSGEAIAYFGYGSLVNPATHRTKIIGHTKATVKGWSRHWQARPDAGDDPVALLTARRSEDPEHRLRGLLVFDHVDNLPALDLREAGYNRVQLSPSDIETEDEIPANVPMFIYEARPPAKPEEPHFIHQSYLDAVLQGYWHQYGEDAVREFLAQTANFDTPVKADRHRPLYQRPVQLADHEINYFSEATKHLKLILDEEKS